ncbi:MAG TPA: hypothetical protein PLK90_03910 [Clostridiales bacterium]|jgi:hypothetical protein|nr:hypothetical protein [Clostridiales bacterium]HQP69525.1 hypothetical protein [Clostridiales bacterium]
MSLKVLKKDIKLIFCSRSAVYAVIAIFILEIFLIAYLGKDTVIPGKSRISSHFTYMQSFMLVSYFPVITSIILVLSFSLPKEKNNFTLAKLLPFGESVFVRSKAYSASILAIVTAVPFLFSAVYFCGLDSFYDMSFLAATAFYMIFTIPALSFFSVSFAVNFFDPENDFQPDVKRITGLMFFVSLFVLISFMGYSRMLGFYYSFSAGFTREYPNRESFVLIISAFVFLLMTRYLLNRTEKRLVGNNLNNV